MKLFEYAVIQQPLKDKDGKVTEDGKILVGVKTILAKDETQVQILAAREVPEEALTDLDRLEVVVRPFERERVLGVMEGQAGFRGVPRQISTSGSGAGADFTAYAMIPTTSSTYTSLANING